MKKIEIQTNLRNRDEIFRVIALGHVTGYPILLQGIPGVGKTKAILDYAGAMFAYNSGDMLKYAFILETDESTRGTAIKGRPDIKKLIEEKTYENYAPITDAKFILINEIDKAASNLKNSLLGVMNEKHLLNGKEIIKCNWEVFAAACNEIPKEEENSPFWDRFVIKKKLNRLTEAEIKAYCANPKKVTTLSIQIPDDEELEKVIIPTSKMEKVIHATYGKLSDRTLSYLPRIIPAVAYIYDVSLNKALVKTTELLSDYDTARNLSKDLEPVEITMIRDQIDLITSLTDYNDIINTVATIRTMLQNASNSQILSHEDGKNLTDELNLVLDNNTAYQEQLDNLETFQTGVGITNTSTAEHTTEIDKIVPHTTSLSDDDLPF